MQLTLNLFRPYTSSISFALAEAEANENEWNEIKEMLDKNILLKKK